MVGTDGQLAVAAVDEHRQPNRFRAPDLDQRIERRAHRSPCVQDVIDDDERAGLEREGQVRALDVRRPAGRGDIVAVEADVQAAHGRADTLVIVDRVGQPLCERHATCLDADERQSVNPAVLLDDLVADANQRPAHVVGGHDLAFGHCSQD